MKLISCQNGRLLTSLKSDGALSQDEKIATTGWDSLDGIAPDGGFRQGSIHEILSLPGAGVPRFVSMMLAHAIYRSHRRKFVDGSPQTCVTHKGDLNTSNAGAIIWCDPQGDLYPPAVVASGVSIDHLYLLRPQKRDDLIWSTTECLRCRGVAVTIASIDKLSRVEARRLQLAAERGGGVGLLLRLMVRTNSRCLPPQIYAAASRWLVSPAVGDRTIQRWGIQLIHGHGGRVGRRIILEHNRQTRQVRAIDKAGDSSIIIPPHVQAV